MSTESDTALQNIAHQLRIDSIRSTSEAGSGHPTSCMSAAEIVATLFFGEMRFDPKNPQNPENDRFVLSKGHAAPVLYAAWAAAGLFPRAEQLKLRRIDSDLEGHPTPRLSFVDVATGSLGQGLCAAIGTALNARRIASAYRTYVLLGDGEMAEGSVWEAAEVALYHKLDNLCGIVDVNALGQSQHTQFEHRMEEIAARWNAFGWHTLIVDGHDVKALLHAYAAARAAKSHPTMILARTIKGKGVKAVEGKDGWHGKAFKKDEMDRAIAEISARIVPGVAVPPIPPPASKTPGTSASETRPDFSKMPPPAYSRAEQVATREAWGTALAALGALDPRVVALDADVKNSTFSERFEKAHPERFYQNFIAEQIMVGAAMGLAARGAIPFASTFACFLSRAYDFIRMAGISNARGQLNVKLTGSHAGVSIGEDGPSQMALEDLAMMRAVPTCTVLYPCDGVSAERLVAEMAAHPGLAYMRTSRPKTDVIYSVSDRFPIGGSKVLYESTKDVATVVAAGVTVFEARKAYEQLMAEGTFIRVIDAYSVQPIDAATLVAAATATRGVVITVEDHYAAGGLGDAVSEAIAPAGFTAQRLAVRELPRSGQASELLDRYGISARHIVDAVRVAAPATTKTR
jgi:transketolase